MILKCRYLFLRAFVCMALVFFSASPGKAAWFTYEMGETFIFVGGISDKGSETTLSLIYGTCKDQKFQIDFETIAGVQSDELDEYKDSQVIIRYTIGGLLGAMVDGQQEERIVFKTKAIKSPSNILLLRANLDEDLSKRFLQALLKGGKFAIEMIGENLVNEIEPRYVFNTFNISSGIAISKHCDISIK
jgi:hypothetical protein